MDNTDRSTSSLSPAVVINIARALRDFGDGFIAVLLPVYLLALGMSELQVGIVSTLTLLGSTVMTLASGFAGARFGERALLLCASAIMIATGLCFAAADAYPAILLIAFFGTINPSSGSASVFVPLEHAVLSRATSDETRTRAFARYSLVGAMAAATGGLAAGSPEILQAFDVSRLAALKIMFAVYGALGVLAFVVYSGVPRGHAPAARVSGAALGPSRKVVYKLAALFSIDAFAGGLVVQSLMALWLFNKFGLSLAQAGLFFFWTGLLSAFSFPVAAWLAKRIGLINTMVFTHLPSSLCLIAAALIPHLETALALLLIRAALSQMDVPTRSSYVMAVVTPAERPAAASVTSVPRGLAAAIGPTIAGYMFSAGFDVWPFIACGVLKIAYDLALLWMFRHVKPPEERQ